MKTTNDKINKTHQLPIRFGCWRGLGQFSWLVTVLGVVVLSSAAVRLQAGVFQWGLTNAGASGDWSVAANWTNSAVPGSSDSVLIDHEATGPFTNVVDASFLTPIQDLTYQGSSNVDDSASATLGVHTFIPAGQKLSVYGVNGFSLSRSGLLTQSGKPAYFFEGDTMLVSNSAASFIVNDGQTANASGKWTVADFSQLNNLNVTVSQFAAANGHLGAQGGNQVLKFNLAQTNVITALHVDDYSQLDFTNSIEFARSDLNTGNASQNSFIQLGTSNVFYADSFGLARGTGGGNSDTPGINDYNNAQRYFIVRFASANSANPSSAAIFRNTNGVDPMTLLALGVDSGEGTAVGRNNGSLNLMGGKVDMLVDQIWLGQNRTNAASRSDNGYLAFDNGTVEANIVYAGRMLFTNVAPAHGFVTVGTNGTLRVNNNITMGYTPSDVTGFEAAAANTGGSIQVNNGGTALINQVNVGQFTTNNLIVINSGGTLVVSNTIADSTKGLDILNMAGGRLVLSVNAGVTNAFVSDLQASGSPTIKIAGISGFSSYPATNVLIAYQVPHVSPQVYSVITPTNFNNLQIVDDIASQTIDLIIKTNAPQTLTWRGGENSNWDHTSLNWVNTNGDTEYFSEGDSVMFDDTPGVPTTINITEQVNPSQVGVGIVVTNNSNNFVFSSSVGPVAIGAAALLKSGTGSLEFDCNSTTAAQVDDGLLTGSGSLNSLVVSAGGTINFSGTINGPLISAGSASLTSAGHVTGTATVTGGTLNNSGMIDGAFSAQSGSVINNYGIFTSIGASTVATNAALNNAGTIYGDVGSTLTIAAGGALTDTVQGSAGFTAGSINLGTLIIGGTFNPGGGGNAIGTTKIADYNSSGETGYPNGRLQLNAGSMTLFNVDTANAQTNTEVLSQNVVYGPSGSSKSINGCTLEINNIGVNPFAAGQSFKLFGYYGNNGDNLDGGLNTTNTYPNIIPSTPGTGLLWDLSQLYPHGIIGVIAASSVQFTLTNSTFVADGTNIVTHLSWPAEYAGNGWLQQQLTTLTNGLGTNWTDVGQSDYVSEIYLTNQVSGSPAVFYRFVRP